MSNKNRYIKFKLPNELKEILHDKCMYIKTNFIDIKFIPMNIHDLHMTVCFWAI